jgi:hypothetical protein
MKRILVAALAATTLLTAAHAGSDEDGKALGTFSIIVLSEKVCGTPLTPLMTKLKFGLGKDVNEKEAQLVSVSVINSWKTYGDKKRWCATAAKNLKAMETKYKKWEAANEETEECTAAWCAHQRAHPELYK